MWREKRKGKRNEKEKGKDNQSKDEKIIIIKNDINEENEGNKGNVGIEVNEGDLEPKLLNS